MSSADQFTKSSGFGEKSPKLYQISEGFGYFKGSRARDFRKIAKTVANVRGF